MASIFHNSSQASSNIFTSGLTVTGGAAIDALTVNGISITGSGGGGTATIDTTGKNATITTFGTITTPLSVQFSNSDVTVPSTSVTHNLASEIDTLNGEIITLNNEMTTTTAEITELQLLVENLTGITTLTGAITTAIGAGNAIATASTAANSLLKTGGVTHGSAAN